MIDRTPWSRREVLGLGLAGAGLAVLGGVPPAWALEDEELAGKTLNLVLRYRTDPQRIARMLPPGLEPDEVAEVTIDWWLLHPERGGENLFFPGPYTESGIHVTARWQGHRGMFQVGMPLDQDWGRVSGRENVGLLKKDGAPRLWRQGRTVRAELVRRGKLLYRVETEVLDRPAHPLLWHRETGFGAFLYRYRLHPDWRRGPLGEDPVELWLRVLGGKRGFYPEAMVEGAPRECDAARTRFELVEPSVLDPFVELPMREIVGVSYRETGLAADAEQRHREPPTPTRIERLQLVDSARFEPWALHAYDRPITAGKPWTPIGWPETATALRLTSDELDRYRRRDALTLELRSAIDLRLRVERELHSRTLPPAVEPGPLPLVRLVALDVARSDVSTEPFQEIWLLARCLQGGDEAWYALSHLVGSGGDVVHGRETFGYPSRLAAVAWQAAPDGGVEITASRLGRDVVRLHVGSTGLPPSRGPIDPRSQVIGLRLHPPYRVMTERGFTEPGPRVDVVAQPWELLVASERAVDPRVVRLELPQEPGPGRIGKPDPWYELGGAVVEAATEIGGVLLRRPGIDFGPLADAERWYAERFDGATTTALATSGDARHTFLVR